MLARVSILTANGQGVEWRLIRERPAQMKIRIFLVLLSQRITVAILQQ